MIDFALEGSTKAAVQKALEAIGTAIGHDLIVLDSESGLWHPNTGVDIVVFVPAGSTPAALELFHTIGPFVVKRGEYDEFGTEIVAPVLNPNWLINVRLSGVALATDTDIGGADTFSKSKARAWLKSTGAELTRASSNTDHPGTITYWERTLAGGDWVRLYWNIQNWKNIWAGGMVENPN